MATPLNPERISPLTGETLTSEKIYWIHVRQAQEIEAAKEAEKLAEASQLTADDYDKLTANEVLEAISEGKLEASQALAYELDNKQRSTLIAKLEALENANTDQGNE